MDARYTVILYEVDDEIGASTRGCVYVFYWCTNNSPSQHRTHHHTIKESTSSIAEINRINRTVLALKSVYLCRNGDIMGWHRVLSMRKVRACVSSTSHRQLCSSVLQTHIVWCQLLELYVVMDRHYLYSIEAIGKCRVCACLFKWYDNDSGVNNHAPHSIDLTFGCLVGDDLEVIITVVRTNVILLYVLFILYSIASLSMYLLYLYIL